MGRHQRDKGKRYERWVAKQYRELGLKAKRGWQAAGGAGDADVIVPGLSIECKHHKQCPNVFDAMEQAIESKRQEDDTPLVHVRQDNRGDLVVVRFEDWKPIFMSWR